MTGRIRPTATCASRSAKDGRTWRLGTVPAGPKYSFDAKLTVPTEAKLGRASVTASVTASVIASGDVGGAEKGFAVLEKRTDERTEAGSESAGQRVLPGARGRGGPGFAARRHAGLRREKLHPPADGRARPRRDGLVFARARPASSGRQDPRAGWEGSARVGEEVTMGRGVRQGLPRGHLWLGRAHEAQGPYPGSYIYAGPVLSSSR